MSLQPRTSQYLSSGAGDCTAGNLSGDTGVTFLPGLFILSHISSILTFLLSHTSTVEEEEEGGSREETGGAGILSALGFHTTLHSAGLPWSEL